MIFIPVDEADAFDRLAIMIVKARNGLDTGKQIGLLENVMKAQLVGFHLIKASPEFQALMAANKRTFDMVELAKNNLCSAQETDAANYERYLAKVAMQAHWKNELNEPKTERNQRTADTGA